MKDGQEMAECEFCRKTYPVAQLFEINDPRPGCEEDVHEAVCDCCIDALHDEV